MKKETILIVEDEQIVASDIQHSLRKQGFSVPGIATSSDEVFSLIEQHSPDLILMDIVIKGEMDGIHTAEEIKKRWNIPIIYLTAYADENTLDRAKVTEPFGYLLKPFVDKELYSSISMAMYKHRMALKVTDSEEKFKQLAENVDDIFWLESENKIIYISPSYEKIWGSLSKPETLSPVSLIKHVCSEDRLKAKQAFIAMHSEDDHRVECEFRIQHPAEVRWVRVRRFPVKRQPGMPLRIAGIAEDITDRKISEEMLSETTRQLKQYIKELEQVNYIASHDLQEPLRMVASYIQLLKLKYKDQLDKDATEYIDYAVQGVYRMQKIIREFLMYTRLIVEKKGFGWVNLNYLFETAMAQLADEIENSGCRIDVPDLPEVWGNSQDLLMVYMNLLENAIKFRSKKKPHIQIGVVADQDLWVFSVKDNGIGLDPKYADRIFNIFQRLHHRSAYSGTGVGLALCKRIVENHEGKIWVESRENQGATFKFTIPIREKLNDS